MRLLTLSSTTSVIALAVFGCVNGHTSTGRPGHGFIGYGINMYDPLCAFACKSSVPTTLECPNDHGMGSMEHMDMDPSPECLTTNQPYLQSLAWCIFTHCDTSVANLPKIEEWWVMNVAGRQVDQPAPNITYQTAIEQVKTPPTEVLGEDEMLNRTIKVDEESYTANYNIMDVFEEMEVNHSTFGLVVFVTGAVLPIGLSLIRLLPFPARFVSIFNAFVIDPPMLGSHHATPVLKMAIVPTRGQALFIVYIIAINIIACAAGIHTVMPQSWFATEWYQVAAYVANRTGVVSFANIPLLILFSGRNNILLWLTNWSHSTFLLVHRWIAWICTLQACIHSALYLGLYVWSKTHAETSKEPFWYWGIIATLALSLMLPLSILPIRKFAYEFFLVFHIILGVVAIVGCWYHIIYRYDHQWGYETWLYVAIAVWAFDRMMRLVRMFRMGVRRAYVSRIDEDYLRIDIPDVDCQGHVYAYFPTLSWRIWENHPFSVVSSVNGNSPVMSPSTPVESHSLGKAESEPVAKQAVGTVAASDSSSFLSSPASAGPGITLFVRTHNGITSRLASYAGSTVGIPVLLEGSYGHESSALIDSSTYPTPDRPNTICIAGGVGITAVIPALNSTTSIHASYGHLKLFWGVRQPVLVDAVEGLIANVKMSDKAGVRWWGNVETHITVGERMNLRAILEREIGESKGTTVVVCGPEGMADEVRVIVAGLGRAGAVVKLVEETFVW